MICVHPNSSSGKCLCGKGGLFYRSSLAAGNGLTSSLSVSALSLRRIHKVRHEGLFLFDVSGVTP